VRHQNSDRRRGGSTPPIIGATIGAKALIEPISDSSRAARTPE
jgi:hypothetical protein